MPALTFLTSMFLHGGWLAPDREHVVPVDLRRQRRGPSSARARFLVFYLAGGLCASLAHYFIAPTSAGAHGRRERRDRRGARRATLSIYPRARVVHAHPARVLLPGRGAAGTRGARAVVRVPVLQRHPGAGVAAIARTWRSGRTSAASSSASLTVRLFGLGRPRPAASRFPPEPACASIPVRRTPVRLPRPFRTSQEPLRATGSRSSRCASASSPAWSCSPTTATAPRSTTSPARRCTTGSTSAAPTAGRHLDPRPDGARSGRGRRLRPFELRAARSARQLHGERGPAGPRVRPADRRHARHARHRRARSRCSAIPAAGLRVSAAGARARERSAAHDRQSRIPTSSRSRAPPRTPTRSRSIRARRAARWRRWIGCGPRSSTLQARRRALPHERHRARCTLGDAAARPPRGVPRPRPRRGRRGDRVAGPRRRRAAQPRQRRRAACAPARRCIVDIFPGEAGGGYHSDLTRTFCVGGRAGAAQAALRRRARRVPAGDGALELGAPCRPYQETVCDLFEQRGHATQRTHQGTGGRLRARPRPRRRAGGARGAAARRRRRPTRRCSSRAW